MTVGERLIVIDMQGLFAGDFPAWNTPRAKEIVPKIADLVQAFGEERTIFTRFTMVKNPKGAWAEYYREYPGVDKLPEHSFDLLAPLDELSQSSKVVSATTFSKWQACADVVKHDESLVMCGVSTNCCVLATAIAAADAGHKVKVVEDACASSSDESHQQGLCSMMTFCPMIDVVNTNAYLRTLKHQSHHDQSAF